MGSEVCLGANRAPAEAYLKDIKIEGWLAPTAANITIEIATSIAVKGRPVCEIGVHHGKFAILLGILNRSRVVGFDLFERQAENEDDSGAGHLQIFLQNAALHALRLEDVVAVSINSLELTPQMVIDCCGSKPILFSVDGGHTEELTLNDLRIAADAVADDGVVMLDDVLHSGFPGVASGLFAFAAERPNALHPFCIGGGKLFLAKKEKQAERLQTILKAAGLRNRELMGRMSTSRFCGRDILVCRANPNGQSVRQLVANNSLWSRVRKTPAGIALRQTFALLRHRAKLLR
jgi:hypothetical protein